MPITADRPLAIYYEHPEWFRPLFAELDRRGIPYERIHAASHRFDPAEPPPWSLVFNRMSPSAYNRGAGNAIFHTTSFLDHLEAWGVRVVNGRAAWLSEISKASQLSLLRRLGLPYPPARVIDDARQAPAAAEGLRFPVVVKPNIGGSGAGVTKFDTADALRAAVERGEVSLGIDSTALVQEFIPQEEGRIVRVEVLGGKYLYGIRIYTPGTSFDLCPADVCQTVDGAALDAAVCAVDAPARGLRVEGYEPPPEVVADVERIVSAAGIEVGGVEYMVDARDGRAYYYDVNALSNFVADAPNVVGFDPFARLVDYLVAQAGPAAGRGEEAA
jgi:biotin carboxylase